MVEEGKKEEKIEIEKVEEGKKEGNKSSRIHSHQEKRRAIDHAYYNSCSEEDDEVAEWVGPNHPNPDDDFE